MTKTVVTLALLGIRQHAVRFGCFFKLLFGTGVVRVLVRVILHRQTPIGALDFLVRRGAANGQDFVIITFVSYSSSNNLSTSMNKLSGELNFGGCVGCGVQHCGCELPGYTFQLVQSHLNLFDFVSPKLPPPPQ